MQSMGSNRAAKVSIRSPRRSKGRFLKIPNIIKANEFQSAPLAEARGDGGDALGAQGVDEVSIRSPRRSKGR